MFGARRDNANPATMLRSGILAIALLVVVGWWCASVLFPRANSRAVTEQVATEPAFVPCPARAARLVDIPIPEGLSSNDRAEMPTTLPTKFASAVLVPIGPTQTLDPYRAFEWSLRAAASEPVRAGQRIELTVIVGEAGNVLFALPTSGPKEFFPRAVEIAMRWKFDPYLRNGKPIVARFNNVPIAILPPERRPEASVAFPEIEDWTSLRIRFTQLPTGFGGRRFELEVRGDGTVTFLGQSDTALIGRHCAAISETAVKRLVGEFRKGDFLRLFDSYRAGITDARSINLAIQVDRTRKSVHDYIGVSEGMPLVVGYLEAMTLEVSGADRWIKGNEFTVPSLRAEGWDFRRTDFYNRSIIAGVARYGDLKTIQDLIALGVPFNTATLNEPWRYADAPLTNAATQNAFGIVQVLLNTGAKWSDKTLGEALLAAASHGNLEICRLLINHNAPHAAKGYENKSVLMTAAESGAPDLVSFILSLGSDVRAVDDSGHTALHWAAKSEKQEKHANRGLIPDLGKVVDLLVGAGARVDAKDKDGFTPLMLAVSDQPEVVRALIAHGANVNARSNGGDTPLMYSPSAAATKMLLDAGADPRLRNHFGQNAIDVAHVFKTPKETIALLKTWTAKHPARQQR